MTESEARAREGGLQSACISITTRAVVSALTDELLGKAYGSALILSDKDMFGPLWVLPRTLDELMFGTGAGLPYWPKPRILAVCYLLDARSG